MRNIDQIRELKKQLEELRKKTAEQAIALKGLRNQNEGLNDQKKTYLRQRDEIKQAATEIQAASNAVMISVAIAYGEKHEDGSFTLSFPRADVLNNCGKYVITAKPDGDMRVITVAPVKEDESGTDDEGH